MTRIIDRKIWGLTGGIGSGKSVVSRILKEQYGFKIIDADLLTEETYTCVHHDLENAFGKSIFDLQGKVIRRQLSQCVFGHPDQLAKLNAIMHPAMTSLVRHKLTQSKNNVILDAALLFEVGWDSLVQKTIVVVSPTAVRIKRICKRDCVSPEVARMRIQAQMTDDERVRRADVMIYNILDISSLERQCKHIVE